MGFKSSQTIYFSLAINCERELQSGGADNLMVTNEQRVQQGKQMKKI